MERRENNIPQQKDESLIVQMLAKYFLDLDVRDETKLSNQVSKSNV